MPRAPPPFYLNLYRGIGLDDGLDPSRLPVTNKRMLMGNFEAVVTDKRLRRRADLERHLSATAG